MTFAGCHFPTKKSNNLEINLAKCFVMASFRVVLYPSPSNQEPLHTLAKSAITENPEMTSYLVVNSREGLDYKLLLQWS